MNRGRSVALVLACTVVLLVSFLTTSHASAAETSLEGPITTGNGLFFVGSTTFDLGSVGYRQDEFFLSGTARSYTSSKALSRDGKWAVKPAASAPFKTRIVVYRPVDPKKFNGAVVVEWLNVTAGIDSAAIWLQGHDQLMREGAVYVGVSAQQAGVSGGGVMSQLAAAAGFGGGLKAIDPARYGTLEHPGDSFSYDIFTQAGKAVRGQSAKLLGGLKPKTVLAIGESQSAGRMTTYLNAVTPSTTAFDGYLVYSRGGAGARLAQAPQQEITPPTPTLIRTDLRQPVLIFTTEADLMALGYLAARQPDTKLLRNWEVPGTAHDDTYGLVISRGDTGTEDADIAAFQSMVSPPASAIPGILDCALPINAGSHTYEVRAALKALERWGRTGGAPPRSPRLEVNQQEQGTFQLDANGNARGGIRRPQVAAPIAKLSGVGQPSETGNLCRAFGTTVPFDSAQLTALYPTHDAFVTDWNRAVDKEVRAGYLLPADATKLKAAAAQSTIPG
jgi:Alpha/beta hydrolase domain